MLNVEMIRALIFASALTLLAADSPPLPKVVAESVEEGSLIRVKNVGSRSLRAFLVEMVDYPGNHFALLKNEAQSPIAPGEERKYKVGSLMPGTAPDYLKATAALYVDGTSAGSPDKIAQLKNAAGP